MEKVIRDGQVGVIVSPGYGAGWYSWNASCRELLFDPQLVAAVEAGDQDAIAKRAAEIDPTGYHSTDQLRVQWVQVGVLFRIDEHDGNETLVVQSDDDWIMA